MNVLFICSGNSRFGIIPFIKTQGDSLKREGVNIEYFPIKGKGIVGYFKNIKKLKKKIIQGDYDVLHAHYGLCGWISRLTFTGIPIVVSFMGDDLLGDSV